MPDRNPSPRGWFVLGFLLPAQVRRRLFEPAYYDLLRERVDSHSGQSQLLFSVGVLQIFLGSSCHGLLLVLRNPQQIQRLLLGIGVTLVLTSLALAILLRDWLLFLASHLLR